MSVVVAELEPRTLGLRGESSTTVQLNLRLKVFVTISPDASGSNKIRTLDLEAKRNLFYPVVATVAIQT
jgi:hypothetical protein